MSFVALRQQYWTAPRHIFSCTKLKTLKSEIARRIAALSGRNVTISLAPLLHTLRVLACKTIVFTLCYEQISCWDLQSGDHLGIEGVENRFDGCLT
jgi:hypothetical protein